MSLQCVACPSSEKLKRVFMNGTSQRYESHFLCILCLQKNSRRAEICHFIDMQVPVTDKEKDKMAGFSKKIESGQWGAKK